jgi:hypothetical protein
VGDPSLSWRCGYDLNNYSFSKKVQWLFFIILFPALLPCGGLFSIVKSPLATPAPSRAHTIKTGPEVGQPIPDFRLSDQSGRKQTFETVKGPKGALIVFYRSADW